MPGTLVSRRGFKLRRPLGSATPRVPNKGRDAATAPSLATSAYLAIRDKILRGQLRSGTPLSRRRLAHELGMSVLPVTDALRRLEAEGLVETRARAGTRVRIPGAEDIREMYELREALESQAARLFAERATAVQRRELERLADEVDTLFHELAGRGDDPAFRYEVHSTHVRFHLAIATYAASAMVKQAIERNHVLVLNWLFDVSARRTPLPIGFHADLARALVSGDPEVADTAIRAHVRYGLREITGNFNEIAASEWRERRRVEPARRARA